MAWTQWEQPISAADGISWDRLKAGSDSVDGRWNHLNFHYPSLLAWWDFQPEHLHMDFLHGFFLSSQHGVWFPRASVPEEPVGGIFFL